MKRQFSMCSDNDIEQNGKLTRFLNLLENSGACELVEELTKKEYEKGGRPQVNPYNLLSGIIYSFSFKKSSLRDMEDEFRNDLRLIYLLQGEEPNYKTIGNFINKIIVPNQYEIFSLITKEIFKELNINMDTAFIDGSKFEANANKYKFVWKPIKHHINLSNKIRLLLEKYNLIGNIKENSIISSIDISKKLIELIDSFKSIDLNLKENKKKKQDVELLTSYLNKSLDYEEMEEICGENRNSYYKTDHDSTAMCLKEDYYSGLGSNMHAGYNAQIMVINGFVTSYLITQSRNDIKDLIPLVDNFYKYYNKYPLNICADSGYGSNENYHYMSSHGIVSYVKHMTWEGRKSGRKPSLFKVNDDKTITCINGNTALVDTNNIAHHRFKNSKFYKIIGCSTCEWSNYCKQNFKDKTQDYRIFEIDDEYQKLIQESENNLLSNKGIEMRVNRSIQVEGVFGNIKQNMNYERFRRRSITKASAEFMLMVLGVNIRKLFKYYENKLSFEYFKLPEKDITESFKKPSIKRINNRLNKEKEKSKNEIAKEGYKYK